MSELIERLRRRATLAPSLGGFSLSSEGKLTRYVTDDGMRLVNPDGPEAADTIESLLSRVERLEMALKPFAKLAGPLARQALSETSNGG